MTLVVVSCPRKWIFERLNLGDLTFQKLLGNTISIYFYVWNFQTSIVTTSICSELERWDQSRATFSIPTIFLLFFMSRAKASCSAYPKCIALGLTSGTCCPSGGALSWSLWDRDFIPPRYGSKSSFWMAELTKMKYNFCRYPELSGLHVDFGKFCFYQDAHEWEGPLKLLWSWKVWYSHLVHWFHRWFRDEG